MERVLLYRCVCVQCKHKCVCCCLIYGASAGDRTAGVSSASCPWWVRLLRLREGNSRKGSYAGRMNI